MPTVLAVLFAHWMESDAFGAFVLVYHSLRLCSVFAGLGLNQAAVRVLLKYDRAGHLEPQLG